ncbi:MAG: hypothetical protein B7733_16575 [Myxococcales bacterium FL481]|nr:MAG: hypothetical protein B7733_16575 [Myxococcales bacterium FL481]
MTHDRTASVMTRLGTPTFALCVVLCIVGLLVRLIPLFEGDDMLFHQPTEDGYLLLTVARNLAIGRGMSTAEGTIATNGVQPLITLVFAAGYYLVDGDKAGGVRIAMFVSVAIAIAAAWMAYRFGRRLLVDHPRGDRLAALAASLWFASPISLRHTTNALETGLYTLIGLIVLDRLLILRRLEPQRRAVSQLSALGVWLGVCFWARNDGVFLAAATCGWWCVDAWARGRRRAAWVEPLVIGGTATVVTLPWVLFNLINFGHPVPVSGRSEGAGATFGGNLDRLAATLAENALVVAGVPQRFEDHLAVQLTSVVVLAIAAAALAQCLRAAGRSERDVILVGASFGLALAGYYGLVFGAKHFLARYQTPVSPLWALLTVVSMHAFLAQLAERLHRPALLKQGATAVLAVATGLVLVQDSRLIRLRGEHEHMQVVEWIRDHVPAHVWVGAVQTGTIGYFHERSLNLDGKVNPAALVARQQRRVFDYIIESQVDYIADWVGMAYWEDDLKGHFRQVVVDERRNLGVLERIDKRAAP